MNKKEQIKNGKEWSNAKIWKKDEKKIKMNTRNLLFACDDSFSFEARISDNECDILIEEINKLKIQIKINEDKGRWALENHRKQFWDFTKWRNDSARQILQKNSEAFVRHLWQDKKLEEAEMKKRKSRSNTLLAAEVIPAKEERTHWSVLRKRFN